MKRTKGIRFNQFCLAVFALFAWVGCTENEHPDPSYADKDWFAVEYDPNADELDQLCYKLYSEEGISFFYNDTLAEEARYDAFTGEPYTAYHKYIIGYSFTTATSSTHYSLSYDRTSLREFIEMFHGNVQGNLEGSAVSANRFFIVDSLYSGSSRKSYLDFYNDEANGVMILSLQNATTRKWFKDMTEEERLQQMDTLYYKLVFDYYDNTVSVANRDGNEFKPFFDYSENAMPGLGPALSSQNPTVYGKGVNFTLLNPATGEPFITQETRPEELGFLSWRTRSSTSYGTPMVDGDFSAYLQYAYLMTEEEFRAKYVDWDLVLAKYEFLLESLRNYGFDGFIGYGADKYDAVLE